MKKKTQNKIATEIELIVSEAHSHFKSITLKRNFLKERCKDYGLDFKKIFKIAGVEPVTFTPQ